MKNTPKQSPRSSAEAPTLLQQNVAHMRTVIHNQVALLLESAKAGSVIVAQTTYEGAKEYTPIAAGIAGRGIQDIAVTTLKSLWQLGKGAFTTKEILPSSS